MFECYHKGCPKRYSTKYNLVRHINSNHLQIKKHICPFCSKSFPCKQNLDIHQAVHKEVNKPSQTKRLGDSRFILSEHYQEVRHKAKFSSYTGPLPVMPPVDSSRQSSQLEKKLPVIPVLLEALKSM